MSLQSLSITAALLPSLQAQYKMDQVNSTGFTGSKAKFTIDLPHHSLSFTTKLPQVKFHKFQTEFILSSLLQGYNQNEKAEANLPSEASIALPAVHVAAEYIPENAAGGLREGVHGPEGVVFRQGGYLNANADIGVFEHSLTTDLLNHLVFVQKVFMKVKLAAKFWFGCYCFLSYRRLMRLFRKCTEENDLYRYG